MTETLRKLRELQDLDLTIRGLEQEARALAPRVEQLDRDLARRTAALNKLQEQAGEPARRRRELESQLKDAEARLERARRQQEMVRTPKELEAANRDLDGAQTLVSQLEDGILSLMEEEEKLAADFASKKAAVEKSDALARQERDRLVHALEEKRALVRDLAQDRIVAANRLDEESRDTYERLLKLHHGPPVVVPLRGGDACGGCGAIFPPQTTTQIRKGDDFVHCSHCTRMVHAPGAE